MNKSTFHGKQQENMIFSGRNSMTLNRLQLQLTGSSFFSRSHSFILFLIFIIVVVVVLFTSVYGSVCLCSHIQNFPHDKNMLIHQKRIVHLHTHTRTHTHTFSAAHVFTASILLYDIRKEIQPAQNTYGLVFNNNKINV